MIVTRKATIGFILLGLIVFLTTQYTVSQMQQVPKQNLGAKLVTPEPLFPGPHSESVKYQYQPPIVNLGNNAPIIVTAIIELFTLGCYLVLKKYEPVINERAVDLVEQFK